MHIFFLWVLSNVLSRRDLERLLYLKKCLYDEIFFSQMYSSVFIGGPDRSHVYTRWHNSEKELILFFYSATVVTYSNALVVPCGREKMCLLCRYFVALL